MNNQEFQDHQKELSDLKMIKTLKISWIVIFLIGTLSSIILYNISAKPKYIELCVDSNLPISYAGPIDIEDLCGDCLGGCRNNDINCPNLLSIGTVCYMVNIFAGIVPIAIASIMRMEGRKMLFEMKLFIGWGIFCVVVRCATIGIYHGIILNTLDQIDDFSQLYDLQVKFILTDSLPLLLVCLPIILYAFYSMVSHTCFCCSKECAGECTRGCLAKCTVKCSNGCYDSCFHYSHTDVDNPIENLSISTNDDALKKNKNNVV